MIKSGTCFQASARERIFSPPYEKQSRRISAIRIEHVWVEAYVRYTLDRGAKHQGGQTEGDSWIPMDPSYKQYTYTQGMDLQTQVPFDADAFMTRAKQGATVNEAEGWVQNLNQANMQADMQAYQNKLKAYIDAQNNGQSTVGQVLGYRDAQIDKLPYLASTLPYTVKTTANRFSELPNTLRHQFRYRIYPDQYAYNLDAVDGGSGSGAILDFQKPTVQLAGKKITIAWVAASPADQAAIDALMPKAHADGTPIQPSELPGGLPASINLKPELRVEGQTQATGSSLRTGSEPIGAGAFTRYNDMSWDETTDQLVAGQQSALGISIQGISAQQMQTLKTRMEATKTKLEQAQAAPQNQQATILNGMTGENLTGDMLTATIWGYFANVQNYGVISQSQANIYDRQALAYGLFHAVAQPTKPFGIVTTGVSFKGLNMDVGHVRSIRWYKGNDQQAWVNYNRQRG